MKKITVLLLAVLLCISCLSGYASAEDKPVQNGISAPKMTTDEEGRMETDYFSLQIPESWVGLFRTESNENKDTHEKYYTFICRACEDRNEGGRVATVVLSQKRPEWIEFLSGEGIGQLVDEKTGETWYAALMYPTDVQFGPDTQEEYMKMYETRQDLKISFAPAEGWSFTSMDYDEMMADVERTFHAVLLDAAMNSMVCKSLDDHEIYSFSYPENDRSRISPAVLGHAYLVTYTGVLGERYHADLVGTENIDEQYDFDRETAMYVGELVLSVKAKSTEGIASLCDFPMVLDGVTVPDEETLKGMEFDKIIGANLARYVLYYDFLEIPAEADSLQVSIVPNYGCVEMEKAGDGRWRITSITNDR